MAFPKVGLEARFEDTQFTAGVKRYKAATGDIETANKKAGLSVISLNQGLEIAQKVVRVAGDVYDATAKKAMDYGIQVRGLAMYTGQSTEETSKLIQVADDLKVEFGTLEQAAKFMFKNGLQPSVESMAQLSDQYLAIQDPLERGEFLTKQFGRAGIDMAEAMNRGGDAIRKMGDEIAPALILTKEQAQAAEDMRAAQDALNDAVLALSVSIGNDLLPSLTKVIPYMIQFVELIGKGIGTGTDIVEFGSVAGAAFNKMGVDMATAGAGWDAYTDAALRNMPTMLALSVLFGKGSVNLKVLTKEEYDQIAAMKLNTLGDVDWVRVLMGLPPVIKDVTTALVPLTDAEKLAAEKMEAARVAAENMRKGFYTAFNMTENERNFKRAQKVVENMTAAIDPGMVKALDDVSIKTMLFSAALGGALGKENKDFAKSSKALFADWDAISKKIDILTLNRKKKLTDEEKKELKGLKEDLVELQKQYDENADAHAEATKRIIFDLLSQRLSIGGLTKVEIDYLSKTQKALGLVDQATYDAMINAGKLADALAMKEAADLLPDFDPMKKQLEDAADAALKIAENLLGIPPEITITVNYNTIGTPPPGIDTYGYGAVNLGQDYTETIAPGRAGGGKVYAGRPVYVGEFGRKELYTPEFNGRITPMSNVSNYTYNYNMPLSTTTSPQVVQNSFTRARLMSR